MDLSPVTPDSIVITVVYTVLLFWGVWVGLLACRGPIRQVGSQTADTRRQNYSTNSTSIGASV
jgi:hypothetical protein